MFVNIVCTIKDDELDHKFKGVSFILFFRCFFSVIIILFSTIHNVTSFTSSLRDLTESQCACAHPGVLGWSAPCRLYITVSSRGQNAELDPAVPLPGHGMDPLSSRAERLVLTGPGSRRFEAGQSGG